MSVYKCIHICIYVYMYTYIYIYLYIHMTSTQIPCLNVCVQPTATHCDSLQLTATHIHMYICMTSSQIPYSNLCVQPAPYCNTHIPVYLYDINTDTLFKCVCATNCNTLQHTAIHCNTLQYTYTCISIWH